MRAAVWLVLLPVLLSGGCVHTPAPAPVLPPSAMHETDDLGEVAESALALAARFGVGRVLVVFDIDNTLLAMEQDLGSDAWWDWQGRLRDAAPCAAERVADPLAVQGALYYASAMRLTQPDAAAQVMRLQAAGLKTLVLTARGPDFRLQTFRELRRNGLSFTHHTIGPPGGYPGAFVPVEGARPVRFEDGVLLTAGQNKGEMLRTLLELLGTPPPAVIVMADDKSRNLQAVLEAFRSTGVSVQAWRYGREDATVAGFDADEAASAWRVVRPALEELQAAFGPDHYALPASDRPEKCRNASP